MKRWKLALSDGDGRKPTSHSQEALFAHRHRGGAGHPDCTEYPGLGSAGQSDEI